MKTKRNYFVSFSFRAYEFVRKIAIRRKIQDEKRMAYFSV